MTNLETKTCGICDCIDGGKIPRGPAGLLEARNRVPSQLHNMDRDGQFDRKTHDTPVDDVGFYIILRKARGVFFLTHITNF